MSCIVIQQDDQGKLLHSESEQNDIDKSILHPNEQYT